MNECFCGGEYFKYPSPRIDYMTELMSLLFVGLGLGLGLLVDRLANQQTKAEKIRLEERLAATDGNQELMAVQMEAVALRVGRQNSEFFSNSRKLGWGR